MQVFVRRQSGKVEFFRNWKNYTAGFGDLNDEFWLGMFTSVLCTHIKLLILPLEAIMYYDMKPF